MAVAMMVQVEGADAGHGNECTAATGARQSETPARDVASPRQPPVVMATLSNRHVSNDPMCRRAATRGAWHAVVTAPCPALIHFYTGDAMERETEGDDRGGRASRRGKTAPDADETARLADASEEQTAAGSSDDYDLDDAEELGREVGDSDFGDDELEGDERGEES